MMLLQECDAIDPPPAPPPGDEGDDRDGGGEPVRWTTIATFSDPTAAHLSRLRVEAFDIPCFIADENIGATAWHYAMATGGIKLQVPRADVDRAGEALRRPNAPPDVADDNLHHCLRCGSSELKLDRWSVRRIAALSFLAITGASMHPLLGVLVLAGGICFIFTTRHRVCAQCGCQWREPPARGFDVVIPKPTEKQ